MTRIKLDVIVSSMQEAYTMGGGGELSYPMLSPQLGEPSVGTALTLAKSNPELAPIPPGWEWEVE